MKNEEREKEEQYCKLDSELFAEADIKHESCKKDRENSNVKRKYRYSLIINFLPPDLLSHYQPTSSSHSDHTCSSQNRDIIDCYIPVHRKTFTIVYHHVKNQRMHPHYKEKPL